MLSKLYGILTASSFFNKLKYLKLIIIVITGSCPPSPKDLVTHCALGCQDERDCKRGQICCPWGCTSVCRYPGKY